MTRFWCANLSHPLGLASNDNLAWCLPLITIGAAKTSRYPGAGYLIKEVWDESPSGYIGEGRDPDKIINNKTLGEAG